MSAFAIKGVPTEWQSDDVKNAILALGSALEAQAAEIGCHLNATVIMEFDGPQCVVTLQEAGEEAA
ncbi:MAG: hypothetical protein AAF762_00200 [Pseudomonadota bacterium]